MGKLTKCVRLTCSRNDIIDIKTALLKTDKIYNVDVRLSSPICKSSCDFHIQINEPQQSLGVGALFHALQSTCLSGFSSDITLPSVDLVSLRTTSLCTSPSPYQNSKALNLSTETTQGTNLSILQGGNPIVSFHLIMVHTSI